MLYHATGMLEKHGNSLETEANLSDVVTFPKLIFPIYLWFCDFYREILSCKCLVTGVVLLLSKLPYRRNSWTHL